MLAQFELGGYPRFTLVSPAKRQLGRASNFKYSMETVKPPVSDHNREQLATK